MNLARSLQVLVVVGVLVSAATGGVVAQSDSGDADLYKSLENMVPIYNENADSVDLGPVSIAGTNNIYIEDGESVVTYSMVINDQNRITALNDSPSEAAKRKITTDRATIEELTSASNPALTFRNGVANDDIVITGEDGQILEGVKWAVLNALKGFFI
ncbi:hypothetical protein [Halonotius roseus]|uniref:Uncharacterized protein n=1 Tax=Halonotius roseus TaxID=2511997 RepID=A0A544QQM5_9EURY|nr:hypothetical protein [Halonotius roseus]TQQ81747.1 hypothetical protein EWF95_02075 [Halonotius roseus]